MKIKTIFWIFIFVSSSAWGMGSIDQMFNEINKNRPKNYKEFLISNYDLLMKQEELIFNKKQDFMKSGFNRKIENFKLVKEMHKKLGGNKDENVVILKEIFEKLNDFNDDALDRRNKFMKTSIEPLLSEFKQKFNDRKKKFRRVFNPKGK